MIYLDSSCLAKLYILEPGSREIEAWLRIQSGQVVCALHGRIEVVSAFKRQQREHNLTETQLKAILRRFAAEEKAGLIQWLPLDPVLMAAACDRMARLPSSVFLRSVDALHLACAAAAGLKEVYSHDRHLLAAALHFGLKGTDVIPAGPAR